MPEVGIGIARVTNPSAIKKLGGKDVLPTLGDIGFRNELHDRAFVIAGVTDATLLTDIRDSLTKAMDKGIPFEQWQREFKKTIEGRWLPTSKTGEPNTGWRARTIYHTNVRAAYGAARRKELLQMTDTHPFWKWRVGASKVHRPDHVMRDGMVLSADDPWWDEHFPPDGYGCNCYVQPVSRSAMERIGKTDDEGNPVLDVPPPDGSGRPKPTAPASPDERPAVQPIVEPAQPAEAVRSSGRGIPQSELLEAKARAELPPTPVRQGGTDLGTAYSFPAIPESVQAHLRSLAQCFSTYAAQAWERIKKHAALMREQRLFNNWAKVFLPIGKEDDDAHWDRVKKLPGYHQEWIIGMFEPHVLAFAEKKKGYTIANAAFGTTGERIRHAMRPSKRLDGAGVHDNDLFRLMKLLASPSDVYWDNGENNLIYVFEPDSKTQVRHGEKIGNKRGKIAVWIDTEKKIRVNNRRVKRKINRMATMGIVDENDLAHPRYEKIPKPMPP